MGKTWLVLQHEFQVAVSRWSFRIFTGLVPLLLVLGVAGVAVYQAVRTEKPPQAVKVGYVDLTQGPDGNPLFTDYRQQGQTEFVPYPDAASGVQALLNGDVQHLYIIPPDYLSTGVVQEIRRQTTGIPTAGQAAGADTPLGHFLLDNLLRGASPELAARAVAPYQLSTVEVDKTGKPVTSTLNAGRLGFFSVMAVLLIIAVFMSSGYLLQGLTEEKDSRIMEVLLSSVRPEQLLLGKLFGLGAAGLLQILVWTVAGVLAVWALGAFIQLPVGTTLLPSAGALVLAIIYFILGYFFFGTLMAALGAVTGSQREANQVTFLVVLPGVAPLWFLSVLLANPDGSLATVLSYIPFTAPVVSMVRLGLDSMPWPQVILSIAVLAASVALVMLLTTRLFRAYLLTYGQRPGLRQLARTLRGA